MKLSNGFSTEHADEIDQESYEIQAPIKEEKDQFPGSTLKKMGEKEESGSAFDVHQTDPTRLKAEIQKTFGLMQRIVKYKGHEIVIHRYSTGGPFVYSIQGTKISQHGRANDIYQAERQAKDVLDQYID